MPLQIKELYIKVNVESNEAQSTPESAAAGPEAGGSQPMDKSAIIAECVEQVMEILKEKLEP